jgi:hypothetical protein
MTSVYAIASIRNNNRSLLEKINQFSNDLYSSLVNHARNILKMYTITPYNTISTQLKEEFTDILKILSIVPQNSELIQTLPCNMSVNVHDTTYDITDNYNFLLFEYNPNIRDYVNFIRYLNKYKLGSGEVNPTNDIELFKHIIFYLVSKKNDLNMIYNIDNYISDSNLIKKISRFFFELSFNRLTK